MRYRRLGKSNLKVSEIGFGAWSIALDWWGRAIPEEESLQMLKTAYDLGINFYETADMYGAGKSERLIGESLSGVRNHIIISTKYGYDFTGVKQIGHAELPQRFDLQFTEKALQASLDRLQTDHLDVYGMHNPKMRHLQDARSLAFLDDMIQRQRIGALQVALGPAIGWEAEGIKAMSIPHVTAVQTVYNMLEQTPGNTLIRAGQEKDVAILSRVPDASGILTGKITAETVLAKNDHRKDRKMKWRKEALRKVEELRPIADQNDLTITEMAIKFILSKGVASVLPTVTSADEIQNMAAISDGVYIPASDMKEISRIYESWPSYVLKA